jgi:hypothetical protein
MNVFVIVCLSALILYVCMYLYQYSPHFPLIALANSQNYGSGCLRKLRLPHAARGLQVDDQCYKVLNSPRT